MSKSPLIYLDLTRMMRRMPFQAATGIDRWELELARRMVLPNDAVRAIAVVQSGGRLRELPGSTRMIARVIAQWDQGQPPNRAARIWPLVSRLGPDVRGPGLYLNASHQGLEQPWLWDQLGRAGLRPVIYIHDLIPILAPGTTRPEQPARHRARLQFSLQHAQHLLCPSQSVADVIEGFAQQNALACPSVQLLPPGTMQRVTKQPKLTRRRPFFLCLGTLEPRKAHLDLPGIWACWPNPADRPDLLVMGQLGWQGAEILQALRTAPALANHLTVQLAPDDQSVTDALAQAAALLMPSESEGWGMPVAEALALGAPVLARDLPVYKESAQGLADLLPAPTDPAGARAWQGVMADLIAAPRPVTGYHATDWDHALDPLWAILKTSV